MPTLGPTELIILVAVLLLLFGTKGVEQIARSLGRARRDVDEFSDAVQAPVKEVTSVMRESVELTEPPLRVFVSSIMNPQCDDLHAEREAAKKAIETYPRLARPWLFEYSPAFPDTAPRLYLRKVRECDLFVLVLGREMTRPVLREYVTAQRQKRPCLVFIKREERTPATQAFGARVRQKVKYAEFEAAEDLYRQVIIAVGDLLVYSYREHFKLSANDVAAVTLFLQQFGTELVETPRVERKPEPQVEAAGREAPPATEEKGESDKPRVKAGRDGKRMILIPAGWFLRGSTEGEIDNIERQFGSKREWMVNETPQRRIDLDAFWIAETPVTNAEYKRFLDAHSGHRAPWGWDETWRSYPPGKQDHPVTHVSWDEANEYARWVGGRLPTEAEWEKAARGTDGRRYPWGNDFDPARCNTSESHIGGTTPVSQYGALGASPYGVMDLAGNVWEWCADWYEGHYYEHCPDRNPRGPASGNVRVVRGGSWSGDPADCRAAIRGRLYPGFWSDPQGFRVVCASGSEA